MDDGEATLGNAARLRWPHGSIEERRHDRPIRLTDGRKTTAWQCEWSPRGDLRWARLRAPGGEVVEVRPGGRHPIFGEAMEVRRNGEAIARFARVSFAAPAEIPAMDSPGALPPGAGTAILAFLAARARAAGVEVLRYRGPYPTAALFDSLLECFRVAEYSPAAALERFVADAESRMLAASMEVVDVGFSPAPPERRWLSGGVCAQLRDGVEKLFVGGRAYARDASGARRLRPRGDGYAAVVEIAGETVCEVAELDASGELVAGPHEIPAIDSPLLGRALPAAVGRALAEALAARAPTLLCDAVREILLATPITWGDPGPDEAAVRGDELVIHPALADHLEGRELLEAIARAIELPAQRLAQRGLLRHVARTRGG